MSLMPAARVGDDIAHSQAGMGMLLGVLAGAAVGAVLIAATISTGGLALVAAAGLAAGAVSSGGLGGMYVGEAVMGPPCGKFVTGSSNVFINGRPATFTAGSIAACKKDNGPIPLATGSSSVMINFGMAGREGEKLGCSAVAIARASPNVFIGGTSAQDPRVTIQPEVPGWAVTALQVLGVAGIVGAVLAIPAAIAAVGVGATIGGAVLGIAGGIGGTIGGRALGEALGLPEAGVRALELTGGFLGGMAGGALGAKGGQMAQRRLAGMRGGASPFLPKKMDATEPGAVPATPALRDQMRAASKHEAMSAEGYPDLPASEAKNFGEGVRPWNGDEHGGSIKRVVGAESNPNGSYWQADMPRTEAEWRAQSAVQNNWNGDGAYVESSPAGQRGWIGPAAPQMSSDGKSMLPGQGEQIWIPPGSATPSVPQPTPWNGGK